MQSFSSSPPPPACPAPFNMAEYVLEAGLASPDKVALEVLRGAEAECMTYGELRAAILSTATGLLEAGLNKGDRLLFRLGNSANFPIAYLAAIAVGILPVPTSAQLSEAEVSYIISSLKPAAILHGAGISCPATALPVLSEAELVAMQTNPPATFERGDPERPAYIIYTSGTSGSPRAVVHAHRAVWARRMMFEGWYGLRADDRLLHAGAFNWTFTLGTGLMDPWALGATALIPEDGTEITALPALISQHKASIFAAAPGVYRKFLNQGEKLDAPALRHGLAAGEKLSAGVLEAWHNATGVAIYEAFGMSECSTFISSSPSTAPTQALGFPQAGRKVAIIGKAGPVPRGDTGTIAVHRSDPGLMLGYLDAEDETRAKFQGDWFLTGDQGVMGIDGSVAYLGRADDMMNAGGYRVSPIEVESAMLTHPEIETVAATEIEVKADVKVIIAFYTSDASLPDATLKEHADKHLAAYKQPRGYCRLDALPTGPNGKLSRRALAPLYEAQNDRS